MTEWFVQTFDLSTGLPASQLLPRLAAALVFGIGVASIHRATRTAVGSNTVFPATLVFLCLLIAMVTQVIGDNVARAFSLVGALSIVRFRTSVRDTKDTAFVIFAVAVGMAVGAGQPLLALLGMAFVLLAALLYRDHPPRHPWSEGDVVLTIRMNWSPALEAQLLEQLTSAAETVFPLSVTTTRHGLAFELSYRLLLRKSTIPTQLIANLLQTEGIQSAELQRHRDGD